MNYGIFQFVFPVCLPASEPDRLRSVPHHEGKKYQPADFLISRPANVEYWHELDLLLRFALQDMGKEFRIGDNVKMEECLLYKPGQANMLFTEQGRCVGWEVDGGVQVHPQYENCKIERA